MEKVEVTPGIVPKGIKQIDQERVASIGISFDGAARFNRSIALWNPPFRSADLDLLPEKRMIDTRVRDGVRNDAYIAGASQFYRNNIVGSSYKLIAHPKHEVLGKSKQWAKEFKKEVEQKFGLWANSPDNWPDAGRRSDLTGLLRVAIASYFLSGEVLATAEWDRSGSRPFKTCIQIIDPDRLETPHPYIADRQVRGGIRMDRLGAPVEYYIRTRHQRDFHTLDPFEFKAVPARKPWGRLQVIHLYDITRPEQSRGVAGLVSALKELNITKKFRDVVLQNAVVNATYAAVVESDLPSEAVYQQIGAGLDTGGLDAHYGEYLEVLKQYVSSSENLTIDGVKIPHLFPGTKLNLLTPGQGGPLGTDFESSLLRYLASSLGISYEQLSKDYSETNYSSARAAMLETWKNMQAIKKEVSDAFASHVYRLWLEEAINTGQLKTVPATDNTFYEAMDKEAYCNCSWVGAGRGQIDELKETQAAFLRITSKLSSRQRESAMLGLDFDDVLDDLTEEKQQLEERGLWEEPNNMMNSVQGKAGQVQPKDEGEDNGD